MMTAVQKGGPSAVHSPCRQVIGTQQGVRRLVADYLARRYAMDRYEDLDDNNLDEIDTTDDYIVTNEGFNAGLSIGVLSALALLLMVAFSSGWVHLSPLTTSSTVSELSATPASAPTPNVKPPQP
jgi:hypothetical protein